MGWGAWRHTAASGCVTGGWNFSDTETLKQKSRILVHLLWLVHDAHVRSLGGEGGHVVMSWLAFNQYIWLFYLRYFPTAGVFTGYTLVAGSRWHMPEWAGPKPCVWTPETQGPWTGLRIVWSQGGRYQWRILYTTFLLILTRFLQKHPLHWWADMHQGQTCMTHIVTFPGPSKPSNTNRPTPQFSPNVYSVLVTSRIWKHISHAWISCLIISNLINPNELWDMTFLALQWKFNKYNKVTIDQI